MNRLFFNNEIYIKIIETTMVIREMKKVGKCIVLLMALCLIQCTTRKEEQGLTVADTFSKGQFGYDLEFLKKYHDDLVLLSNDDSQLIVLPAYQGRVMTSTSSGLAGVSYGWINHELIASGQIKDHINVFGGEERFWLGPEGGQFSIYFKEAVPFTFEHWFVPKELDTEAFTLVDKSSVEATFSKEMNLTNYSGTKFQLKIDRSIRLIGRDSVTKILESEIPDQVKLVSFESDNRLTNKGTQTWTKKSGMLSIWILSMLNASENSVIGIPYKTGKEESLGKVVTDDYFGKVPSDRLNIKEGIILLKADSKYRSKVGISPQRALPWICSYDEGQGLLTIAQFSLPSGTNDYVNSLWEQQKEPFKGDAVNAYNDGPLENGDQLGNFYEIESSSPAASLQPGESLRHVHRTIHLQGSQDDLDQVLYNAFGIHLNDLSF